MSIDAWVRALSLFSLTFQGYSVCFSVEPILYAVVSFSVMLIQLVIYASSKPSLCPKFDQHRTTFTASLTIISVLLNFGDSNSVVAGNVVTTLGIVLEAVDFGMNLEYRLYAEMFGYKIVPTLVAADFGSPSKQRQKRSKKKKSGPKSD